VAAEEIGHQAAQLLDSFMRHKPVLTRKLLISPLEIVTRQSTDTLAIHDPVMAKALGFIRRSPSQGMQVGDVAQKAGVSRRALERHFLQSLGRAPAEEIRRVRLDRAKQLLVGTDLPISEVADAAGFGSPEYLTYVFRRSCEQTPLKYRQTIRGR
jgi:LacI family transcriptional regulator